MTFSKIVRGRAKTNNNPAALKAKTEIRARVLEAVTATAGNGRVFDAFAGAGDLYRAVWHQAFSYVGCDTTWYRDERLLFAADSRRVMRAIDLGDFNIFDFDAWGNPWEHALILSARRQLKPGETIGLTLTEGASTKARLGGLSLAMALLGGLRSRLRGAGRNYDDTINRAIVGLCRRMNCRVVHRWQAQVKTGSQVRYIGLVLQREEAPLSPAG